jgi:hypothetical protein
MRLRRSASYGVRLNALTVVAESGRFLRQPERHRTPVQLQPMRRALLAVSYQPISPFSDSLNEARGGAFRVEAGRDENVRIDNNSIHVHPTGPVQAHPP